MLLTSLCRHRSRDASSETPTSSAFSSSKPRSEIPISRVPRLTGLRCTGRPCRRSRSRASRARAQTSRCAAQEMYSIITINMAAMNMCHAMHASGGSIYVCARTPPECRAPSCGAMRTRRRPRCDPPVATAQTSTKRRHTPTRFGRFALASSTAYSIVSPRLVRIHLCDVHRSSMA